MGSPGCGGRINIRRNCLSADVRRFSARNFAHALTLGLQVRIPHARAMEIIMNGIVYLVGMVVIVLAVLSFVGLR
jgi:hypothetical protein